MLCFVIVQKYLTVVPRVNSEIYGVVHSAVQSVVKCVQHDVLHNVDIVLDGVIERIT